MPKTKFERIETGSPDIAVFRISGKLGFHENDKVEHLTEECTKRNFGLVVFDLTELSSLGGGVARILREFVTTFEKNGGKINFVITNDIVRDFLADDETPVSVYESLEKALDGKEVQETAQPAGEKQGDATAQDGIILMSYDGDQDEEQEDLRMDEGDGDEKIISEIFESSGNDSPPSWIEDPVSPFKEKKSKAKTSELTADEKAGDLNRKLKRRILELKTLLSISTDFNNIRDRKNLMDIFLLTSIAQGGVESAAFFESSGDSYIPVMMKGLDQDEVRPFSLSEEDLRRISGVHDVVAVDSGSFDTDTAGELKRIGLEYFYPFRLKEGMAGIVFLGKRITGRGMQREDFEFMKILINVAAGAYHNAMIMENEHERTLGIVKTLISLIEENTLLTGTSEFVSRYVGMVAKNMDYPEEYFKDLIYGTVLRDMGMIKVSDLIVRSPRELSKEEWLIINKHPEDGAEMLRRMKFSNHVINIVLSHHERFNGEGYPRGLRGKEIPLGARIISVIESYSAMINERPNRPALSGREALDTLKENYGLRYDREVVRQFVKIIEKELARSVKPGITVP